MERLLAFVLRNCFITDRSLLDLQTPSPKPMTTQGNRDNIRATSIYGSNVTIPITANGISITLSHSLCNVERNGRKTLTTVQGLPKKFDQKKILKVIKKKFACNGTIVNDAELGEVIQLQGDQRKDVQEFLVDKKDGLDLDPKAIKVREFGSLGFNALLKLD
ncbi:MAG: hypothetical protein Q9190_005628 [Brigantiaea leucoxantha]